MALRQTMRRTVAVVACLPTAWERIRDRATATVSDWFRVTAPLQPLPRADIGRAILERRFVASYAANGFHPPYPSWPILPAAFADAPDQTPRQLLIRADTHVRECLKHHEIIELGHLTSESVPAWDATVGQRYCRDHFRFDRRFAEYRGRAVPAAALDPDGEDTTVPALLSAALKPGSPNATPTRPTCAARRPAGRHPSRAASPDHRRDDRRRSALGVSRDRRHQRRCRPNRIKSLWCCGIGPGSDRRAVPAAQPSLAQRPEDSPLVAEFDRAGGRTLRFSEDDLRTLTALRDLIDEDPAELASWLRVRRPAHGITLLREALGDDGALHRRRGPRAGARAGTLPDNDKKS